MPKTKIVSIGKKTIVKPVKKAGLSVEVLDIDGKSAGKVVLPKEIFGVSENDELLAQSIRVYLVNHRQGTVSTKTRGEVAGSTRKIYRQKGTGRARHGSIKAPIFVGGGIIFGPKPHDFSLKIPKKMKKQALLCALTAKFKNNDLLIVDSLEKLTAKTKNLIALFKNLKIPIKHGQLLNKILLVTNPSVNIQRAGRNIANLTISSANLLNPYLVLTSHKIIFEKEAVKLLWNKQTS